MLAFFLLRFFMTTLNPASNPWRDDAAVIGLVGIAHASSHFSHLLLPLMFPVFMSTFGLSYSELGFLMTVFFVVSGIGQASAGFVVDRFGARPILFGSLVVLALGALTVAAAQSYWGLMLGAALLGLGNCTFHPVDFTILNQKVSAPRLGYAFSAHGLTGNLGWALAPVFMVGLSAAFDWRIAYIGAALMFLAIFVLLVWQRDFLHADVVDHKQEANSVSTLAFLKIPVVWWCFGFFLLSTMTLAVVQNFSVPILKALHGIPLEMASMTLTAYMLCGAVGMLVGGFVAARNPEHSDRVVAWCLTGAAMCMALCASGVFGQQGTLVVLAATGFAVGVGGPSRDMMIKKATPKGATGRVYGLVYSGLDVGFAIAPVVFGYFMDQGWYTATLLSAAFILLLSVGAALGVGLRTRMA